MQLKEYEIELISYKIGAKSDNARVSIQVGVLRALIERNSYESDNEIEELERIICEQGISIDELGGEISDLETKLKPTEIIEDV